MAWNESTNETGCYEVTAAFSHLDPVLTELIINGEWIETTPEHPFGDLKSGDKIRKADGTSESVWLKWDIRKYQEMYNLTVDEAHTYFVGDGQWLVHYECKWLGFGKAPSWGEDMAKAADSIFSNLSKQVKDNSTHGNCVQSWHTRIPWASCNLPSR